MSNVYWPLYEVFVRGKQGLSHRHVGSLHAADERMALENARDAYTRRSEGCSIWVVKASEIVASQPEERGEFFDPAESKVYRHPTFYTIPDGIEHRSEEHTSELQSRFDLVCRLLLEKKKKKYQRRTT